MRTGRLKLSLTTYNASANFCPKVSGNPDRRGLKVLLTCSLDCSYSLTLDGRRTLRGTAVGRVPTAILFAGGVTRGAHALTATAVATVNAGPPATDTREFVTP